MVVKTFYTFGKTKFTVVIKTVIILCKKEFIVVKTIFTFGKTEFTVVKTVFHPLLNKVHSSFHYD